MKTLKALIAAAWLLCIPLHPALISVMVLPLVDLVLGLLGAKKAGLPITSAGLKRTVAKVFMYELATILAFITESYLLGSLVPVVKMITGLIGMTELKSCLEHLDELGGQPLFASILTKLAPPSQKDDNGQDTPTS